MHAKEMNPEKIDPLYEELSKHFGVPTLETVMHEFRHYLVYCIKKGKEKKE